MAKKPAQSQSQQQTPAAPGNMPSYQVPEVQGYESQNIELTGYWAPLAGYIHFVPREVTAIDNKLKAEKPSILIIGELVEDCPVHPPESEDENETVMAE